MDSPFNSIIVAGLTVAVFALFISVAVIITGIIIRLRAQYNPKVVQLDPDASGPPRAGNVTLSFWGMLRRVYRLEGCGGLFKGMMPTVPLLLPLIPIASTRSFRYNPEPISNSVVMVALSLSLLLVIPVQIIIIRATTTTEKLSFFGLKHALRALLSPAERSRPWLLYLVPGMLVGMSIRLAYGVFVLPRIYSLLISAGLEKLLGFVALPFVGLLIAVLNTAILSPLDNMIVRLAIQPNPPSMFGGELVDAEAAPEEAVLELRTDREPYTSLVNCAKCMVDEEGYSALYRVWWVSILLCLRVVS